LSVGKIRHPKKRAMLAALSELGNVTAAARLVGIHHDTHYQWMKRDPQYAEQVPGVLEQAADLLEAEARRRAVEGVTKPEAQPAGHVGRSCKMDLGYDAELPIAADHRSEHFWMAGGLTH
jgi:transposase-like protein